MNTASTIAQFLAVLGGSANPALMTKNGATSGNPDFRSMMMAGFGGQAAATDTETANSNPSGTSIWQIMNANSESKNALVLQLSKQGVNPDAIDTMMQAADHSELITIIRDPELNAQLQGLLQNGETGAMLENFIQMAAAKQQAAGDITANIADMNLEEFKEWKKNNFADLASFLSSEKTKIGANGQVIKILQGPAFLSEDGAPSEQIVDIVKPQDMNAIEFALQYAQLPLAQNIANPKQSFTPLPFSALNGVNGELADGAQMGLQNAMTNGKKLGLQMTSGPANGAPKNAAALGNIPTKAAANGNSALTPFMTPADLNGLMPGGEGVDSAEFPLPFEAGFKTASHSANPLLNQPSAAQAHQTTQMVAVSLTRMAAGKGADAETQNYRLKLDPPEMGRIDVELKFEAGNKVQAMITADKPETLQLLQRDAHALLKALQDAGFDAVGQNNLEFNLSQGQNDSAGQGDQNPNGRNGQNALLSPDGTGELADIETEMSLIVDPVTGQQRINMVV